MKKIFSILIIISVFSLESFSAYYSMSRIWDKKSNMELVSNWLNGQRKQGTVIALAENIPVNLSIISECSDYYGDSIIDLLNFYAQDSSFTNRTKLAETYRINNYIGTTEQNMILMAYLKSDLICKQKVINLPKESEEKVVPIFVSNCPGSTIGEGC